MTAPPPPCPEITVLAAEFPEWQIGTVWQSAPSGPDKRNLTARRGPVLLAAADAAGLREKIRHEEARG